MTEVEKYVHKARMLRFIEMHKDGVLGGPHAFSLERIELQLCWVEDRAYEEFIKMNPPRPS